MGEPNKTKTNKRVETSPSRTVDEVQAMLLEHLSDKYGESFVCDKISGKSVLSDTFNMTAYPSGGDTSQSFSISYNPTYNTIYDGYYGVIIRNKIADDISRQLYEAIGKHKLFVRLNSTYFLDELKRGVSAEEATQYGQDMSLTVTIFVSGHTDTKDAALTELRNKGYSGILQYYLLAEQSDIENIDDKNFIEKISLIQTHKIRVTVRYSESF